ncbi:MAG: ATP-binding protein [Cetobacterium sp.]|uniref:ATP-binding protein n=1 Tax=Cetobacterium sp. TaxID=2071632 RepID=UPI003EE6249E
MLDAIFDMSQEAPKKKTVKKAGDDFAILTPREHCLKRPNMYIGSVSRHLYEMFLDGQWVSVNYVAGMLKIMNELIDNSVDEAIRTQFKHANKIDILIDARSFSVEDNGRGIPQDIVVDGITGEQLLRPVAAWTRTMAGSNFSDDENRVTIGMNGVGSALSNYYSTLFIGVTRDGKNQVSVTCRNNGEETDVKQIEFKRKKGTKVTIVPDFTRFNVTQIDDVTIQVMEERIRNLAIAYPEIDFTFNGKKVSNKFKEYAKRYSENVLQFETPSTSFLMFTTDQGFRTNSFVNGVHTKEGGTHINVMFEHIADALIPMVKRKYKLEINRARVKECTSMVLFIRDFPDAKFDSQTKERLTNTAGEVIKHIGDMEICTKIAKQIVNNEALIMPIIESALARKLAAEQAAATRAEKAAKKIRVAKHIKANGLDDPTVKTTLFLTEGDSAIGYLVKVRDKLTQGGFPLRGKVLNVWDKDAAAVRKNKELFEIMAILNLTIGKPATDMSYDRIAVMTDADVDGTGSIYPLLIAFFYKHWPEIVHQGRLLFVKTPQYISEGPKKEVVWSYDQTEFESKTFKGSWNHRYIKGLGSLREHEYKRVMREPVFEQVEAGDDATEVLELLFGKDSDLRKEWILNN